MTPATVDIDATVLDGLDFAHVPPCETKDCDAPAEWRVRWRPCCSATKTVTFACGPCVMRLTSAAERWQVFYCMECSHKAPVGDWIVSVHRIDGGEQR